jgi:hypothetical protein
MPAACNECTSPGTTRVATVAWGVAAEMPDRLASVSAFSVPHSAAFLKALVTSRQAVGEDDRIKRLRLGSPLPWLMAVSANRSTRCFSR